uniref:Coiled-coil domain-containing protein 52 n=1 Tax=Panagrellus redivivus TaxID=6233 RepID=A0A7E4V7N5_PANRE
MADFNEDVYADVDPDTDSPGHNAYSPRQKIFHPTTIHELTNMVAMISSTKKPTQQGRSQHFQKNRSSAPIENYLHELESEIEKLQHVTEAQQTQITDLESYSVGLLDILSAVIELCAGLEQRLLKDESEVKKCHDSTLTSVSGPIIHEHTPIRDDVVRKTGNIVMTPVNGTPKPGTSDDKERHRAERKRGLENVISPHRRLTPSVARPNVNQVHSDRRERPLQEQKTKPPYEMMTPKSKQSVQKVSFTREYTYSVATSMSSIDESLKRKPQRQIKHQSHSNPDSYSKDDEDTWSNDYNNDNGSLNATGFQNCTPSRSRNRVINEHGSTQSRRNRNSSRNIRRSVSITRVTETEDF